jgi:hypothetical protein
MSELIQTLSPNGLEEGARIERAKYDLVRKSILENLRSYGPLTFTELGSLVEDQLKNKFKGSISWYFDTVRLDVETRGEIRRVPNSKPQVVELGCV